MMINAPDLLFQSVFTRQLAGLRQRLDGAALELVTGRRADTLAAARGDNNTLLRAQAVLDAVEPARARLAQLDGRYRVAASALRTVGELAALTSLDALAAGDFGGAQSDAVAASEAEAALRGIFGALDARFGGRALFAGDRGTEGALAPVADLLALAEGIILAAPDPAAAAADLEAAFGPGGAFETTIYGGGAPTGRPELPGGTALDALPTANDGPVRDLLRGLAMIAFNERLAEADRPEWLQQAAVIVRGAGDRLVAEEASIGLSLQAIERDIGRQDELRLDAELTLETILGRDPFEAASETRALEVRLEAAYTVVSRVSNLRLTNFLR